MNSQEESAENCFDYKTQKILADLDYAVAPYLGDQIVGYYRIGLIRAMFPKSNITAKINNILSNFYFKEADKTIYDFNDVNYSNFHIIFRYSYQTGAERCFYSSQDIGLDYPLQTNPNNRDFTGKFKIHLEIFEHFPKLLLKNYSEIESTIEDFILNEYNYDNIVYLAFREGLLNEKKRNFRDAVLKNLILKLSREFKNTLFIMHTYKKKWAYFFYLNNIKNVLTFSQLLNHQIQKLNVHKKAFDTAGSSIADLNLEVLYVLINKSDLFITAGNTGLGCFAQYVNPNMLCFIALNEIYWITKNDKYHRYLRRDNYSDFTENDIFNACESSIQKCINL